MKSFQVYCVRRIMFSVALVVFLCIVAGCGQAHISSPTPTITPLPPTPTVPTPTPTQGPPVLGHGVSEDGWEVTLVSAKTDNNYPIVETDRRPSSGLNCDTYDDALLVLHVIVKNVSSQDPALGAIEVLPEPYIDGQTTPPGTYTPVDKTKILPDTIPLGSTAEGDIVYSIYGNCYGKERVTGTFLLVHVAPVVDVNTVPGSGRLFEVTIN